VRGGVLSLATIMVRFLLKFAVAWGQWLWVS